jgi:hypothetical protein
METDNRINALNALYRVMKAEVEAVLHLLRTIQKCCEKE